MAEKPVMRDVLKVRQSPVNAQRWCLDLSCRHEKWVTAKSKPKAKRSACPICTADARSPWRGGGGGL